MIRTPNTGITPWGLGSGDGIHLKRVKNWEWGGVDRPLPSNGMGRTKGPARCGCIRMTWNPTGHPHHQNPGSNSSYTLVLHLQNGINRNKPQPDNGWRGQANAQPPSAVLPPPPPPPPQCSGPTTLYACHQCDATFATHASYKRHWRRHWLQWRKTEWVTDLVFYAQSTIMVISG